MFGSPGGFLYVLNSLGNSGIHCSNARPKILSHTDLPNRNWQGSRFVTAWLGTRVKSYMDEHMNKSTVRIKKE